MDEQFIHSGTTEFGCKARLNQSASGWKPERGLLAPTPSLLPIDTCLALRARSGGLRASVFMT